MSISRVLNHHSLDAPLVLTTWLGLISYWLHIELPWWVYPWLAAMIWIVYTWDRIIDAYLQPHLINDSQNSTLAISASFSARHQQHWQYRKIILTIQGILAPWCVWGLIELPSKLWEYTYIILLLAVAYLSLTYVTKKHATSSTLLGAIKHLLAAVILSLGLIILSTSYSTDALLHPSVAFLLICLTYLIWLNMRCCEYWDNPTRAALAKSLLSLEIISLILLLEITELVGLSFNFISLPLSFISIIVAILSIHLVLVLCSHLWVKRHYLLWADMSFIICPLIILPFFLF